VSTRGRPRSDRAASAKAINIKLRLYPGEDDDLILFFDSIPQRLRAIMVKQALRSGTQSSHSDEPPDEEELLDALDSLIV
jgi:hypothetical protein